MFEVIGTAGTGLQTYHTWLDVIANNVANMNDTTSTNGQAFTQHYLEIGEIQNGGPIGDGVAATAVTDKAGNGYVTYEPGNPLADAKGEVRHADVNLNDQMTDMIMAQRGFQANAQVVDRAKDVYEAAIAIGKGI